MLHTEEFEILVPDEVRTGDKTPLILRIGPMTGMLIPVIVMALFGSRIYSGSTHNFMYFGMVTALSSALSGITWAAISSRYRKKEENALLKKAEDEFEAYLSSVRSHLEKCAAENRDHMYERYRSSDEIVSSGRSNVMYPGAKDRDFLRLGRGRTPFQMKIKVSDNRRELFESKESERAKELAADFEVLNDVPVGIELGCGDIIGVVKDGDERGCLELFLDILIKVSDRYSGRDVKTCLFFDESIAWQRNLYEAVKFMPHMFAEGGVIRLMAGNEHDVPDIIPYLGEEQNFTQGRCIVFVLNPDLIKGEIIEDKLLSMSDDSVYTTIYLADNRERLPVNCRSIIFLPPKGVRHLSVVNDRSEEEALGIMGDKPPDLRASSYHLRKIFNDAGWQDPSFDEIPQNVGFLKLFDASAIGDIDIGHMWESNYPEDRLRVPIGLGNRCEKVYLDVHERFGGPHGLIAGTTGSGKSELIQTYLISLCLCYSPREVNFFIIDYKGGGTGNALRDLPHCAGVISNLSGSQIKRAMSAIRSENAQRQMLLGRYGVAHIDEYNRRRRNSKDLRPLPHLLLIIDEFAELRKEEPDFMQEIISLSAVGRSLGIHLILATQKPSGVVDDKIWSNSRFKLCLKVQDKQDSMDMLKRPEAAYLKRAGQCYMQIGLDEYFRCFQTGYIKEAYDEGEKEKKVLFVRHSGKRVEVSDGRNENAKTLLDVLTSLIADTARSGGYEKCRLLWTDELPDVIENDRGVISGILGEGQSRSESKISGKDANRGRADAVCREADEKVVADREDDGKADTARRNEDERTDNGIKVLLGVYDDPANQRKEEVIYEPARTGHLAIAGCPGSGRTGILKNLALGLHDYELILIDLSNGPLNVLKDLPNCRGYLFSPDGMRIFFYHLKKLLTRHDLPVFILIDNFGLLVRSMNDDEASFLGRMIAEGIGNNIYFIITAGTVSDIPSGIFSKIKTSMCLEMTDKFGYADMLRYYRIDVTPKKGIPGRGLIKMEDRIYEFQAIKPSSDGLPDDLSGYINAADKFPDTGGSYTLTGMIESCMATAGGRAGSPEYRSKGGHEDSSADRYEGKILPVGYSAATGMIRGMALREPSTFVIMGNNRYECMLLLDNIRKCMEILYPSLIDKCVFIREADDPILNTPIPDDPILNLTIPDDPVLNTSIPDDRYVFMIIGRGETSIFMGSPFAGRINVDRQGIYIGNDALSQNLLDLSDVPFRELNRSDDKLYAFMRLKGRKKTIRMIIPTDEKESDKDDYD